MVWRDLGHARVRVLRWLVIAGCGPGVSKDREGGSTQAAGLQVWLTQ